MDGPFIINALIEAEAIKPGVSHVRIEANADGYLSITTEYDPAAADPEPKQDEWTRLRLIEKLASKIVKLQLEDGQVDDRLAEQLKMAINQDG